MGDTGDLVMEDADSTEAGKKGDSCGHSFLYWEPMRRGVRSRQTPEALSGESRIQGEQTSDNSDRRDTVGQRWGARLRWTGGHLQSDPFHWQRLQKKCTAGSKLCHFPLCWSHWRKKNLKRRFSSNLNAFKSQDLRLWKQCPSKSTVHVTQWKHCAHKRLLTLV